MVKIKEFVAVSKQIEKPQSPGSRGLKKNKEGSVRYFSAGMKFIITLYNNFFKGDNYGNSKL